MMTPSWLCVESLLTRGSQISWLIFTTWFISSSISMVSVVCPSPRPSSGHQSSVHSEWKWKTDHWPRHAGARETGPDILAWWKLAQKYWHGGNRPRNHSLGESRPEILNLLNDFQKYLGRPTGPEILATWKLVQKYLPHGNWPRNTCPRETGPEIIAVRNWARNHSPGKPDP